MADMGAADVGDADGEHGDRAKLTRTMACLFWFAALLSLAVGLAIYRWKAPQLDIIKVELPDSPLPLPLSDDVRRAVGWDFALIAGYGLALLFALFLACKVFWSARGHAVAICAVPLAATAVAADVVENVFLLSAGTGHAWTVDGATAAAVLKFCCLTPAAIVALAAMCVTAARFATGSGSNTWKNLETCRALPVSEHDPACPSGAADRTSADRWRRGYLVPGIDEEKLAKRDGSTVGIGLSGGGVRSASVALGAMQTLRTSLRKADYLVSISGGGYTAGALQMAMTDAGDGKVPEHGEYLHQADEAFMPGSVEEDWFRRHADYLADSAMSMVRGLSTVAGVLLLSLAFLFAPAIVLGVGIGRFYKAIPVATWDATTLDPWGGHPEYPTVRTGTWVAIAVILGVTLLAHLVALMLPTPALSENGRTVTKGFSVVAIAVVVIALGIPSLVFGASWLLSLRGASGPAIGGPVGTVLLTYVATLASILRRKEITTAASGIFGRKKGSVVGAVPNGALQLALVVITLFVLALSWLLLLGGMAAVADQRDAWVTALVILVVLVVAGLVLDQTSLSLHPYYRRRLAKAFAVRRLRRGDGNIVAEGYPYSEFTTLSRYGKRRPGFPEVIFAGTANLTGQQRTPVNGVPYVMSADWVGGPDLGYIRTGDLEAAMGANSRVTRDLTVQASVAISGAAFASAMGNSGRWYQTLLAVTGMRLGTWLPNPVYADRVKTAKNEGNWTVPRPPGIRRLPYLLREVFVIHGFPDRLVQVTDGGHYESLGLVELLRRRCTHIYCIDASGDSPPTTGALDQSLSLAYSELGVEFDIDETMWELVPGSAPAIEPSGPLSDLDARLSLREAIRIPFEYPAESGLPEGRRKGTLIFTKTLLTPESDFEVLSYAARNGIFPRDSTGDQFFEDSQFYAYRAMGREMGTKARDSTDSTAHDLTGSA